MKRRGAPIDDLHNELNFLLDQLNRHRWARRLRATMNGLYAAYRFLILFLLDRLPDPDRSPS